MKAEYVCGFMRCGFKRQFRLKDSVGLSLLSVKEQEVRSMIFETNHRDHLATLFEEEIKRASHIHGRL